MPSLTDEESTCAQLRQVSRQMLARASEADWAALTILDRQRLKLAQRLAASGKHLAAQAACIDECLQLDAELLAVCRVAREKVAQELRSISQGIRVHAAYLDDN